MVSPFGGMVRDVLAYFCPRNALSPATRAIRARFAHISPIIAIFAITHHRSGRRLTFNYNYPSNYEHRGEDKLMTYYGDPIPMKDVIGADYEFIPSQKDYLTFEVFHNFQLIHTERRILISISEALGYD